MSIDVKSKFDLHCFHSRRIMFFVSLMFVIVLFSSGFVSVFNCVSPFVSGASDVVVSSETKLRNAVNNAVGSTIIALERDIVLTGSLVISANKNITLTSNSETEFFKLIGAQGQNTIAVYNRGLLTLDVRLTKEAF